MIKSEPELKKHLPPLPDNVEKVIVQKDRHGGDRAEKDFGFECTFPVPSSFSLPPSSRLRTNSFTSPYSDEPFDQYIGAYAKQVVELANASGELRDGRKERL